MDDFKKYDKMEVSLRVVNKQFISLSDNEIRRNNQILSKFLEKIVEEMRRKDEDFNKLYNKMFYGGSYYDGLKVGKPDEYDIDMILGTQKTKKSMLKIITSNKPGFVHAELLENSFSKKLCARGSNMLDTDSVKQWIQGLVQKVLNDHYYTPGYGYDLSHLCGMKIWVKMSIQGPACTFSISGTIDKQYFQMDMDLVPCFYCFPHQWPCRRPNPSPEMGFLIVPKKPSGILDGGKYWRLSFQDQERDLLNGKEKVKPALKLLKKMRDSLQQTIASYFLKTVTLWELEKEDPSFWATRSLSYTFMRLLKAYTYHLKNGKFPYYWDDRHNMLTLHQTACDNYANRLQRIINHIDRDLEDGNVILEYMITPAERKDISPEVIDEAIEEAKTSTSSCIII